MGKTPKRVWAIMHQNFVSKLHVKILMQSFDAFFERVWAALSKTQDNNASFQFLQ